MERGTSPHSVIFRCPHNFLPKRKGMERNNLVTICTSLCNLYFQSLIVQTIKEKIHSTNTMINRSSLHRVLVILLLFLGSLCDNCIGFSQVRSRTNTGAVVPTSPRPYTSEPLHMAHPELSSFIDDPTLEAESLSVMAHIALDFSGFVLSPSRSLLRIAAILGRIFALTSDYLYDHSIHTEELMIQLFLISVTVREIVFSDNGPMGPPMSPSNKRRNTTARAAATTNSTE
mmetsp:Transcript_27380/g.51360  ORF Transcript_27380/g.51360 Transcript_27380/m.51360 type:complete len:230 (+) Transcript_27380:183-872(+)